MVKEEAHYTSQELPKGNETILFVDNEEAITKIGKRILEGLGYSLTTITNSTHALDHFCLNPTAFDLVISDMTMPKMTGDILATMLMKTRPDVPVILCIGYSKKISDGLAAEIGIKAFAHKPIVQADLAKSVRKVLDAARIFHGKPKQLTI